MHAEDKSYYQGPSYGHLKDHEEVTELFHTMAKRDGLEPTYRLWRCQGTGQCTRRPAPRTMNPPVGRHFFHVPGT